MTYIGQYTLNKENIPVPEPDILAYYQWEKTHPEQKYVGRDERMYRDATVLISTVYLGINHNFLNGGTPILWETMVFGPDDLLTYMQEQAEDDISSIFSHLLDANDIQRRYTSYKQAVEGHRGMVAYTEVCIARLAEQPQQ